MEKILTVMKQKKGSSLWRFKMSKQLQENQEHNDLEGDWHG
ncbi:uncharacterized protein G2W53_040129 [Senna tora]|uniref:Uncharacterized protein n=1 Tax=Senna tora TaxID=362788 RepID=A0A834SNX9_9FABA|nr:uncharacterized protein G2W53_040129 [Senna tora]